MVQRTVAAFGPFVEWQVLAENWAKPQVGLQLAAAGHLLAASGWLAEYRLL